MAYEDTFIELQNTLRTIEESLGSFGRRADGRYRGSVAPIQRIADLKIEPMIRYANEQRFNEVTQLVAHARMLIARLVSEYDDELEDLRAELREEDKNG